MIHTILTTNVHPAGQARQIAAQDLTAIVLPAEQTAGPAWQLTVHPVGPAWQLTVHPAEQMQEATVLPAERTVVTEHSLRI